MLHETVVEPDHVGHHHSDGLTVGHPQERSQRVGQRVGGSEHRCFDRHAGERGAELHLRPAHDVGPILDDPWKTSGQEHPRLA